MKNLKKILSVVLVVAMMLGLMISASATIGSDKYADYDLIQNKTAVDTLTSLGVLDGKDNDLFDPLGTLTRAELSKIIFTICIQRELTPTLTIEHYRSMYAALVDFTDVSKTAWFAGPIGYAQTKNIVSGHGDGTFGPDENVQLVQVAKMLLGILKYNPVSEGYQDDPDWIKNIMDQAAALGLFEGIDLTSTDPEDAVTRDQVAQMVYNALYCDVVEYVKVWNETNGWTEYARPYGEYAIHYYFGKDTGSFRGIVIANSYANLSNDMAPGDDYSQEFYHYGEYSYSGWFDLHDETVVYVPRGECVGTGICAGVHNVLNAHCPRNNQWEDVYVLPFRTGIDEIGREVEFTYVQNAADPGVTYLNLELTDNNSDETIYAGGNINANSTKLDVVSGTFACEFDLASTYQGNNYGYLTSAQASSFAQGRGYVTTLIDNNKDGKADFAMIIEKELVHLTAADVNNYPFTSYKVGDMVLYYLDLIGTPYIVKLDPNSGIVNNFTGRLEGGYYVSYENITLDGIKYLFSELTTADIGNMSEVELDDIAVFYLDESGSIVWINLTDYIRSRTVLIYGMETNNSGVWAGTGLGSGYTLYTLDVNGNYAQYVISSADYNALPLLIRTNLNNNAAAIYAEMTFSRSGLVTDITTATNVNNTSYAKSSLVLGSFSNTRYIANADFLLETDDDDVDGFITDDTAFFSFTQGFGLVNLNLLTDRMGFAVVTNGPATVPDITTASSFRNVQALVSNAPLAGNPRAYITDVVVLTIDEDYAKLGSFKNAAVDKTDPAYNAKYVYITVDAVENRTFITNGYYDVNETELRPTYTVPCTGSLTEVVLAEYDHTNIYDEVTATGGALYLVVRPAGSYVDTLISVSAPGSNLYFQRGIVETVSPELDRVSVIRVGRYSSIFSNYVFNDARTLSYTADTIVYELNAAGNLTKIPASEIARYDYIEYIVSANGAYAFAETISVAFVTDNNCNFDVRSAW